MDFDLRALVREVCSTSTIADPALLAKEVNRQIKKTDRDAALEQSLRIFVQHYVSLNRNSPADQAHCDTQARPVGGGSISSKVAGIRNTWRRMLQDRIAVGSSPGDWKFLKDCTVTDLDYAATLREDHARRNAARAKQLRELAGLLTTHRVTTVGQLPEMVLAPALGEAA